MLVRGAARLLFHPNLMRKPPLAGDLLPGHVLDLEKYTAKNGWLDLGATKTGVVLVDNSLYVALAEMTLENIDLMIRNNSTGVVQLVVMWMKDEGLELAHFPIATYRGPKRDPNSGEAQIPIQFKVERFRSSANFSQVFGPSSVSPPIFEGKAIGKALPPPPRSRLYATLSR